ncbi:MAG: bifunctional metallophosphatase/5'-nucleotidase [Burkholderiales bacterium]|nr:bifunctional metallophosphatase/5'-nucleotidase [Burkholderiales bacterium]
MATIKFFSSAVLLAALAACAQPALRQPAATADITIFSINDFHGNLQAAQPVPYMATLADPGHPGQQMSVPAGGYAYLAALLKQRRAAAPASILVGGGDLIGASPIGSAILRDEPVIEALNQLGLAATAVGNHEFDAGAATLLRKLRGECPATGCAYPGFRGAAFDYLAANVSEQGSAQPWLKPYVIRQVGEFKVGFIGAVTADVPNLVAGDKVGQLRFEDEASAVNRYVPELQRQGVAAIVLLIHEGADYAGAANDPSYRCEGLHGPIIAISKKLDPAISLIVSGHSHQAYTCKIDGRLVMQGGSYGAYLSEATLSIDRNTRQVLRAVAYNHLIAQHQLSAEPQAQQLVQHVAALTAAVRNRPVATLAGALMRDSAGAAFDSALGNVIADAQLSQTQNQGGAEIAFMNEGGIRADLPSGHPAPPLRLSYGDLYAAQPFGNTLVRLRLSGAQILALLQQQWQGRTADDPKKLFVSDGFSYRWNPASPIDERVQDVRLNGQPLLPEREYSVVVNSFLAGGGDGFSVLKQGTQRQSIGQDLEALEAYVQAQGERLANVKTDRVRRAD